MRYDGVMYATYLRPTDDRFSGGVNYRMRYTLYGNTGGIAIRVYRPIHGLTDVIHYLSTEEFDSYWKVTSILGNQLTAKERSQDEQHL